MKNNLDILDSIKKVETPPYLYAKILHHVSYRKAENITLKEMIYLAIPCAAILIFVVLTFVNTNSPKESIEIARGMHLLNNNSLY